MRRPFARVRSGRLPRWPERGSAAIELLAAVPLLLVLAAVSWYLAAGLVAAMDANEQLVRDGLDAGGIGADVTVIDATRTVPSLGALPQLEVTATARVRGR